MSELSDKGPYTLISLLSKNFAKQIHCDKEETSRFAKKLQVKSHEIILKKFKEATPGIRDWDDDECLNITLWEVYRQYKALGKWSPEKHKYLCSLLEKLRNLMEKNTGDSSLPSILRMLISISVNYERSECNSYMWGEEKRFIPKYEEILKHQNEIARSMKMKNVFTLQKQDFLINWLPPPVSFKSRCEFKKSVSWCGAASSNMGRKNCKIPQTFSSYTLDEGFVTPNEDHKVLTPLAPILKTKPSNEWLWDIKILRGEVRKKLRNWEGLGTVSKPDKCFVSDNWREACKYLLANKKRKEICIEKLASDIISLLLAISSSTFIKDGDSFLLAENICIEGILCESMNELCQPFIDCAEQFTKLKKLSQEPTTEAVSQALRKSLRTYLYKYQELVLRFPQDKSIMSIKNYMRPLMSQVNILNKVLFGDGLPCPKSYLLLERLYLTLNMFTEPYILHLFASIFFSCCEAYYRLLDNWVWKGEAHPDLFVIEDPEKLNLKNRLSWILGYTAANDRLPSFLRPIGKEIYMCGKMINLLKMCDPQNPLLLRLQLQNRPKILLKLREEDLKALQEECSIFTLELMTCIPKRHSELLVKNICQLETSPPTFLKVREEQRRKEAERKALELEERKKEIEEVRARRQEEQRVRNEEDKKMREIWEKDELEKIKKEEEIRKELVEKYKQLSIEADKRRIKTEWRMNRLELSEKRRQFLQIDQEVISREEKTAGKQHISEDDVKKKSVIICEEQGVREENKDLGSENDLKEQFSHKENGTEKEKEDIGGEKTNKDTPEGEIKQNVEEHNANEMSGLPNSGSQKIITRNYFYDIVQDQVDLDERDGKIESKEDIIRKQGKDLIAEVLRTRKQAEETKKKILGMEFAWSDDTQGNLQEMNYKGKLKTDEIEVEDHEEIVKEEKDEINNVKKDRNLFSYKKSNNNYFTHTSMKQENIPNRIDFCTLGESIVRSVLIPVNSELKVLSQACLKMEEEALMKHLGRCRKYLLEGSWKMNLSPEDLKVNQQLPESLIEVLYKGVSWPLNIILTPKSLAKYETAFSFFVTIQKAAWALEQVLILLKIKSVPVKGFQYRQIHLQRYIMAHYISALQMYLLDTVLEGCWVEFKKSLTKVKDIDELYKAHVSYLKEVSFKCLLNKRSEKLKIEIIKLLETVFTYHDVLRCGGEWSVDASGTFCHSKFRRLRHTFRTFLQLGSYITKYISRLVQLGYQAQDLEVLHKLLTLNSFYMGAE